MFDSFLQTLATNWADTVLFGFLIFFTLLGMLRGFGRTFVYTLIFFGSAFFALWWFTPYLRSFSIDHVSSLLINLLYFWAGNTAIAWAATKIVMALDTNGVRYISRIGGAFAGAFYAIALLLTANVAYVLALPEANRLAPLPQTLEESAILQKSDNIAANIYVFMQNSGTLAPLTSRELDESENLTEELKEIIEN